MDNTKTTPTGARALSVEDTRARLAGISRAKLYEAINSGALRTFQIGRRRLVSEEALAAYIRDLEAQSAT